MHRLATVTHRLREPLVSRRSPRSKPPSMIERRDEEIPDQTQVVDLQTLPLGDSPNLLQRSVHGFIEPAPGMR